MQEFFPIMSTIFTSVKGNESDAKIPLLFLPNDENLQRWINIEESYMSFNLPGTEALALRKGNVKQKPLALNDFKPLYGLRVEDINYLAGLVESKKVCVKSSKAKGASAALPSLQDVANREKQIRVMKNKMMCYYRKFNLPSKKPDYVPYIDAEWEGFAIEKKVTRAELATWLDKALVKEVGRAWMEGRTQNFNKTHSPSDCPKDLIGLWEIFIEKRAQADVAMTLEAGFA